MAESVFTGSTATLGREPQPLIVDLSSAALTILSAAVGKWKRIALVDYPAYSNVGDSAIWLGERRLIDQLGDTRIATSCPERGFVENVVRSRLRGGAIVISGGGNFGDLWPLHQRFREMLLRRFRDVPIVQLPQSIYFGDNHALERCRAVIGAHRSFLLMVRDRWSYDFAKRWFDCNVLLCTDMAFGLGPLRRAPESMPILWLRRTDKERAAPLEPMCGQAGVAMADWVVEFPGFAVRASSALEPVLSRSTSFGVPYLRLRLQDLAATERLDRGLSLLSQGRVVVTDRLHGHILCLLAGIPHVLIDNCYGKIRRFYDSWTWTSPITYWARDERDALSLARDLAGIAGA